MGKNSGMSIPGLILLLLFTVPWSGLTLLVDLHIGWAMIRQIRALGYSTVMGTVTHSSVVEEREGNETHGYDFDIRYEYVVEGSQYNGSRYRYGSDSNGDRTGHYRILASFPVGGQVKVHYNPNDPGDAVLRTGIVAADIVLVMAMLPFNLMMLGLWLTLYDGIRSRLWPPIASQVKSSHDRHHPRVLPDHWTPLYFAVAAGAIASGLMAFLLTFIVVFGFGLYPHLIVPLAAWGLILCTGGLAGRFMYRKAVQDDFAERPESAEI